MSKEVIGTCPSTGEVLVRDTDTGDMSWEAGTSDQIDRATKAIKAAGRHGTVEYEAYQEPEPPVPPSPVVAPEAQVAHVAPTTLPELELVEVAETTGGYFGLEALTWLIDRFNWLSEYSYNIYLEVLSWVFPFSNAAYLFYFISAMFSQVAWGISSFSEWAYSIAQKAAEILSWSTIWSYILSYVPNLEAIRDWFYDRWNWFATQIANWWAETSTTVAGWIDEVWDRTKLWIDYLEGRTNTLQSSWDSFVTITLPSLPNWLDIEALIQSWTKSLEPFWEGWQEWKDKITNFIKDPEQWFYDRLDEIFERFW